MPRFRLLETDEFSSGRHNGVVDMANVFILSVMIRRSTKPILSAGLLLLLIFLPSVLNAQEKQRYQSLEHALGATGILEGSNGPQNVIWIEGGERYSYYEFNAQTDTQVIRAYTPATGKDVLIFNPADHRFPGTDQPFTFREFQWSSDFRYLLFQANFTPLYRYSGRSDYYYYSLEDESIELITEDAFTAELSPDGRKVGFGREGELYVYDLESGKERQLTFDSEENLFNGRFGWVYEEEFGKVQAWEWSRDSRYIAYWQSDERDVEQFVSTDYEGQYPEYTAIPYPKAGEENPSVRIGVVDTGTGEQNWIDLDLG
ncbi:MAG: DPP IV N-terminal domain-containing protein, partial [Balneolaceae bacterium]